MNQPLRCKPVRARGPLHAAACAMMLAGAIATMAVTPARAQMPASGTPARDPSPPASTAAPERESSPPAKTAAPAKGLSLPAIPASSASNPSLPAIATAPARNPSLPAIPAGARLAANCAACHGTNGVTDGIALPSLAGQGKGTLLVALKAFKSGARQGTIMPQIARGYTDEQLAQLAEFFAAQPPVPVAALPPSPGQPLEPPPVSRLAVTGWPQEHAAFAGYGHAAPILRAAGGQP